ncbi:DUF3696 domain-containing protein [Pseudomonas sp. NPDC089406]|uniref:AAA family ATPase n=1 Tax=Pseudomonas sp. NPDC089406 TaxID=3364463 RepID=UPI00384D816E
MISSLEVKNFKCFKSAHIPLKPITVVCGGNGVGKSSMIQTLLLMRQAADQLRKLEDAGAILEEADVEFPIKLNGPYRLALGNSLRLTNDELDSDELEIKIIPESNPSSAVDLKFVSDVLNAKVTVQAHYRGGRSSEIFKKTGLLPIFSDQFHYLVAERNGPRDLSEVSDERYLTTGLAGEHTADAIARAEAQNHVVHEKLCILEGSNLFKVQLEGWMRMLVPNIKLVTHPYPEINRVRLSLEKAGTPVDSLLPTSTGFGISYVLPIVVSGLLCPPGAMLVVENPEAHLHPAAQSAIGQFLAVVASTGVQVVVETHSENVINGVRLSAVRDLINSDEIGVVFLSAIDGDTQPKIDSILVDKLAELSSWPRGFFDQQGSDLAALMAARRAKRSAMEASK